MLYSRYQAARDAAWRTLIRFDISSLPVDVEKIAGELRIDIQPWPDKTQTPVLFALLPENAAAASLRIDGVWRIFTKPNLPYSRYRFAVAHELGHLILQHKTVKLKNGVYTFDGLENAGDILPEAEKESDTDADMFAIRLLAPACVLHSLHIASHRDIAFLCGLPENAAQMRSDRMALLNGRNAYYTNPLEKRVQQLFWPFIRKKQAENVPHAKESVTFPLQLPQRAQPPSKERKPFPLWAAVLIAAIVIALLLFIK